MSFMQLNQAWELACRDYAASELAGPKGPWRPIGSRSRKLLSALWSARAQDLPDLGALIQGGGRVLFFGDPHFGHANIIRFCDRPFEGVEAMDQALWESIERAAQGADACVCLGDWALCDALAWHEKAATSWPGKMFTVVGNHDAKAAKPAQWAQAGALASLAFEVPSSLCVAWAKANPGREPEPAWDKLPETIRVGLSHWPLPPRFFPGPQWVNLHGHTHGAASKPLRMNASMEAIDFEPAPLAHLLGWRILGELSRRQGGELFDEGVEPDLEGL